MKELTELLQKQKEEINKSLEQNGHDMYALKLQEAKLKKMLKNVEKQLEIANEPEKKEA